MTSARVDLYREMRKVGFSKAAIDAAWPSWWTDEADSSPSARAELRFALARNLGLAPKPLLGERVEFFWDDAARFKHLRTHNELERTAIASYGISVGRLLIEATSSQRDLRQVAISAQSLRDSVLSNRRFVDLQALIGVCWSLGIPIIHLGVVPLQRKSMHAMVVQHNNRYAILLARNASYPAPVAFTVAHELGHVLLGHIEESGALVDLEDPSQSDDEDNEENEADSFALELLTGSSAPTIEADRADFNAPSLARAAIEAASTSRVEPGTLALSIAYQDGSWARSMSALKFIYQRPGSVAEAVNEIARNSIDWRVLTRSSAEYLERVMAIKDD